MATKNNKNISVPKEAPKVYVYIGPSIRGVIQNGTIYDGQYEEILNNLSSVIEMFPKIKKLLVADCDLAHAMEKLKQGKNSVSNAYAELNKIN